MGYVYRTVCVYAEHKGKIKYAIIPGIIAGTAFQAFQYLYIGSQIWVSRYNAIYGSFAAIPMFLLWTQISWSICLYGAELCYVAQNLKITISVKRQLISVVGIMTFFASLSCRSSVNASKRKNLLIPPSH